MYKGLSNLIFFNKRSFLRETTMLKFKKPTKTFHCIVENKKRFFASKTVVTPFASREKKSLSGK